MASILGQLKFRRLHWKVVGSTIWLIATFSLTTWWFIFAMSLTRPIMDPSSIERRERMIFWEGGTLLGAVFLGGLFLIWFTFTDTQRNEQLRLFFSNFAHDLKTSIARIRLQAEIIAESVQTKADREEGKRFDRLLKDLRHLYLQLENSLLLSHLSDEILEEKIRINELVESLRLEFEGIDIELVRNAEILGDSRAIRSVFRNLFENSIVHGASNKISLVVDKFDENLVHIDVRDNGKGTDLPMDKFGKSFLPVSSNNSNGVGLYIVRKMVEKMNGDLRFSKPADGGFAVELQLRGVIL